MKKTANTRKTTTRRTATRKELSAKQIANRKRAAWIEKGNYAIVSDLLQVGNDTKTIKGERLNVLTGIMYLTPGRENAFGINLCPMAELAQCLAPCLNTAGRGGMSDIQSKRLSKTNWFLHDPESFMEVLARNIRTLENRAEKLGMIPAVRLNGTSDILWEKIPYKGFRNIMEAFKNVVFYDYTKRPNRASKANFPANYDLTFSYSEADSRYSDIALREAAAGNNVAVVFPGEDFPETFHGIPVVSGIESDARFLDEKGKIIALCAKGKALKDESGFVVREF